MRAATLDSATIYPPVSNRGGNWTTTDLKWDWYQATMRVPGDLSSLLRALAASLGVVSDWMPGKGLYGYAAGYRLAGVEQGSVQVFVRPDDVHVQATSTASIAVAEYLRRTWPEHTVSRADVALDTDAPGSFDRLWRQVHGLAREGSSGGGRKISTTTAGDWIDGEKGRTLYAGGKSSPARVVVYEKGHEQMEKDPNCAADLNWTRVEWRLRPDTPARKAWLGKASPAEALALTAFAAACASSLLAVEMTAVTAVPKFASQDPMFWMVAQYNAPVRALLAMDPLEAMQVLAGLVEALERAK